MSATSEQTLAVDDKDETLEPEVAAEKFSFDASDMPKMRDKPKIIKYTPKMAHEFLETNQFHNQRNVMDKRLEELGRKMEDGRFHGSDVAIAHLSGFDYDGLKKIMMNGQHTSLAVIKTGVSVWITLKEFDVENVRQLGCLWAQFDAPGGARTPQQICNSFLESMGDKKWDKKSINLLSSAVTVAKLGTFSYGSTTTTEERIQLMLGEDFYKHAVFCRDIAFPTKAASKEEINTDIKWMTRVAVLSSMVMSHRADATQAKKFWTRVRDGGVVDPSHPALQLQSLLQSAAMGNTRGRGKHKMNNHEAISRCAEAWHAFQAGTEKDFKLKRTYSNDFPSFEDGKLRDAA